MMTVRRLALTTLAIVAFSMPSQAHAGPYSDNDVTLEEVEAAGTDPGSEKVVEQVQEGGPDGVQYRLQPWCDAEGGPRGAECLDTYGCDIPGLETLGQLYWLMRSTPAGSWTRVRTVCVDPNAVTGLAAITPELVLTEFRKLKWPKAELIVQPVGGETLVNFPTNFYTENAEPTTQQVTLLGTQITIEATPTSYTWHFNGGNTVNSEVPGLPAPDPDITDFTPEDLEESPYFVTHRYVDAHVIEQPSVDVTYTGRYRLGGGAWTDIPDTLTVTGDPVQLSIIEATPRLVG